MRPSPLILTVLTVSAAVRTAAAQPEAAFELEWDAPDGCSSESQVIATMTKLLDGPPADVSEQAMSARATVTRGEGDRWNLRLATEHAGASWTRRLDGESCEELASAAALVLALAIDPDAVAANSTTSTEPASSDGASSVPKAAFALPQPAPGASAAPLPMAAPTPEPVAPPAPDRDRPPAQAPPPERATADTRALARLSLVGDVGTLPSAGGGGSVAVGYGIERFHLEGGALLLPGRRSLVDSGDGKGGQVDLVAGGIAACYAIVPGDTEVAACAGAEAGVLRGEGFGVKNPASGTAPWVAGLVAADLSVPIAEPVSLRVRLEALAPIVRERFVLDGLGEVHRAAPVAGRLMAGPEVHFP